MRTQEEILKRFKEVKDIFGTQRGDLISYLTFENAKIFLKEEYVKKVENEEEEWEVLIDAKKEILDYLKFAYEKAESQKGLSAARSMLHFKTWVWIDNPDFYKEIISDINNYYDYGLPTLDKISAFYGYSRD